MPGTKYLTILVVLLVMLIGVRSGYANTLADIEHYFEDEDIVSLPVADQQFPALEVNPAIALARGVAIVLVSSQSQSMNLDTGLALANELREKGWRTLLIPTDFTSAQATQIPPPAGDKPITNLLTSPVDYDAYRTQIIGLINSAYNHAQQYKGYTFVVAQGMTSAVLLDAFHNNLLNAPDTLISIGAFWPGREQNKAVIEAMAQSPFPLLDISLPSLSQWQQATIESRKVAAKVNLKLHYRQRIFANSQGYGGSTSAIPRPGSTWLAIEIYSWLRYLGW